MKTTNVEPFVAHTHEMLSPLSAVQTNTRVTRSRANANATPGSTAKPAIHASPVKANPSPAARGARAPPATPATPAAHIPNAPPPTPASPMFAAETNSRSLAESLGKALSSALAAVPEPMPLSSTPEADLGADLSRAMEDLVVDPMSDLVAIAIAASAPTTQVKADADVAVDMLENEDEEDDDASSSFDNASEETEDDSMGVTNRMRLHGMLPPGT